MASQNLNVGTAANANDGDTLRAAFIKVKQMFAEVYGQTYSEQGDLSGVTFEIKEDKLKATNTAVDGYVLTYDSSTGGFTWKEEFDGDITSIVAGDGLTGTSLDTDDATLNVVVDDATIELSATDGSGVVRVKAGGIGASHLAADAIDTTNITNDAVTPPKLDQFDDSLTAATAGDILVSNGTDFIHATMSGDATIASGGALTIGDDKIDYDKLAGEFTTSSPLTAATDLDIDFSTAAVFTTTSAIAMDLNFTNAEIGQVKTIIVTDSGGTSSLTFDTATNTVTTLNGTYDATAGVVNVIQVICTASNTFFVTISQ